MSGAVPAGPPALSWFRAHAHHVAFTFSLLTLIVLAGWWAVYLRRSVERERDLRLEILRTSVKLHAAFLGAPGSSRPAGGPLSTDSRLETSAEKRYDEGLSLALDPAWPELYVQPLPQVVADWVERVHRRSVMVAGESSLLVVLLLVSCVMLYRLIRTERRTAAEVRELWGRVTHEIKTPIAGLKSFLQTLKSRPMRGEELASYVDMALRQIGRQEQLAENLLIGQGLGKERPALRKVDLGELIASVLHDRALELVGVTVHTASLDRLEVMADPEALRVIVDNLTENAVRYAGEKPRLEIAAATRDGRVAISFSDNGRGFDPQEAREIFEAYRRLAPGSTGGRRGTGMGLAISRALARRMKGELGASSPGPGRGARFTLELRLPQRGRSW